MKQYYYSPYEKGGKWYYLEADGFECGPFPSQIVAVVEANENLYYTAKDTVDRSVYA